MGGQPIDILIANAGVYGGDRQDRLGDLDYDAWLQTFAVNVLGPVRLAEAFVDNVAKGRDRKMVADQLADGIDRRQLRRRRSSIAPARPR